MTTLAATDRSKEGGMIRTRDFTIELPVAMAEQLDHLAQVNGVQGKKRMAQKILADYLTGLTITTTERTVVTRKTRTTTTE